MANKTQHVTVENHGSIVIVQPLTDDARQWLKENVQAEATWHCGGLVVEPRYVEELLAGFYEAFPPIVQMFTDAPVDYDYPYVETLKVSVVYGRLVELPEHYADYQRGRYMSGLYIATQDQEMAEYLMATKRQGQKRKDEGWVVFTRRTADTKLLWLQSQLDAASIPFRREGRSFHAPILKVRQCDEEKAWAILGPVDDVPDDDARFDGGPNA